MSDFVLRAAKKEDVPSVLNAERLSFSDPWTEGMLLSSVSDGFDFTLLFDGEALVGYSILDRRVLGEAELHNIAIIPDYRGKGLSSLLMDKIISDTEGSVIFLEVRAGNAAAIGLYKKHGFTEIGKRKNYYKNPPDDAIIMQRHSTGASGRG